eukprot:COSAG01_NODE_3807_length_5677_cov_7.965041_5_plen_131_part_00
MRGAERVGGLTSHLRLIAGEFNRDPSAGTPQQQFAFTLAAFLIVASDSAFFGFSDGWCSPAATPVPPRSWPPTSPFNTRPRAQLTQNGGVCISRYYNGTRWHAEYEKSLGTPLVSAVMMAIHPSIYLRKE